MSFPGRVVQRAWHLVDAKDQTVGRLATQIAPILRGKHKPTYRPNADCGDFVVVINAEKVRFSGKKWDQKLYRWHTGYPGGLKQRTANDMMEKKPTEVLRKAVIGMLKRNNLRHRHIEPRLRIFAGDTHSHEAQLPSNIQPLPQVPDSLSSSSEPFHFGFGPPGRYSGKPLLETDHL